MLKKTQGSSRAKHPENGRVENGQQRPERLLGPGGAGHETKDCGEGEIVRMGPRSISCPQRGADGGLCVSK